MPLVRVGMFGALFALAGCGSGESNSLFDRTNGVSGTGGTSGSGGDTAGGTAGVSESGGGSTSSTGATGNGGDTTTASGGFTASGGTSSSGGTSGTATPPQPDGGPGPAPFGVATTGSATCAGVDCAVSGGAGLTNICCVGIPPFPTGCYPTFPGCVTGATATISCDDATDCPNGQICCGTITNKAFGAKCAAACDNSAFQVCRTNTECSGHICEGNKDAPGYGRCK